ncbi:MAG: ComF family protein, partial [Eubacteriales bacterium]|nr:ComF family protein [Eubacteriales bacterium]
KIIESGMVCKDCEENMKFVNQSKWTIERKYKENRYDGVIPTFYYAGKARNAVARLKFKGNRRCSAVLADYMVSAYKRCAYALKGIEFDYVVAVPMHKSGVNARGYNQSQLLAERISQELSVPIGNGIIFKSKKNKTQHNLDRSQRKKNVEGIYTIGKGIDIQGKNILLVDDVLTTGHTAGACSLVLKENGANKVWVIVVAVAK